MEVPCWGKLGIQASEQPRAALSHRIIIWLNYVTLNFLIDTLEKVKWKRLKLILITFYWIQYINIISTCNWYKNLYWFLIINELFCIFNFINTLVYILHLSISLFECVTFQVLSSYVWLMAIMLYSLGLQRATLVMPASWVQIFSEIPKNVLSGLVPIVLEVASGTCPQQPGLPGGGDWCLAPSQVPSQHPSSSA